MLQSEGSQQREAQSGGGERKAADSEKRGTTDDAMEEGYRQR